jgi:predicted Zn-dependent protease
MSNYCFNAYMTFAALSIQSTILPPSLTIVEDHHVGRSIRSISNHRVII